MIQTVNHLQENAKPNFSDKKQQSTNLNSRKDVVGRLRRGKDARSRFVESHLDKGIAFQLRALRDRETLSQQEVAAMVGTTQNAISRLESSRYGKPTITTLKKFAEAFDVALVVRFVPFSQLIDWVSGTPRVDRGLSTESVQVPSFAQEEKGGAFDYADHQFKLHQFPEKAFNNDIENKTPEIPGSKNEKRDASSEKPAEGALRGAYAS
jgi:transcriptional regulator with XRE-family HTH domain